MNTIRNRTIAAGTAAAIALTSVAFTAPASAAPATAQQAGPVQATPVSDATDFSARRRGYARNNAAAAGVMLGIIGAIGTYAAAREYRKARERELQYYYGGGPYYGGYGYYGRPYRYYGY